uniref:PH domain-containing protein n=2 Tax=Mesocestoides corti TaxID=53468 RepID=A0A5K3EPK0_MESCO
MSEISEKILEIERNIHEGETMLSVLHRLPESEETNAQINRFQDLVRQLEDYRDRYKALEVSPTNNIESQVEALRHKHDGIKLLFEQSVARESLSAAKHSPSNAISGQPREFHRHRSSPDPTQLHANSSSEVGDGSVRRAAVLSGDTPDDNDHSDDGNYVIEPSEWHLHYQAQTSQLSSMLSQISCFQEMVGRLSRLVIGLGMTEAATLLSDVGQRFTEVHVRLISLHKAYEALYNHENSSSEFRASQLKELRVFLITLGRSLEVTKDCFHSVADVVKRVFAGQSGDDPTQGETMPEGLGESEPPTSAAGPSQSEALPTNGPAREDSPSASEASRLLNQTTMELALADLCKQRDDLLNQLAEVRSKSLDSAASPKGEHSDFADLALNPSAPSGHHSGNQQAVAPAPNAEPAAGVVVAESLPILKRLQARKEHLEELRSELRSFSFSNSDEMEAQGTPIATSKDNAQSVPPPSSVPTPNVSIKVPSPSPHASVTTTNSVLATSSLANSHIPARRPNTQGTTSIASSDSDAVTQKCEVVTFQEPEATYSDNTERLYKSMREARIWREEHRQQPVDSSGGEKDVTKGGGCNRLRNGLATVPSESTSCMDATAMATWGGDSERDDNDIEDDDDDAVAGEEFIEDVPSVVSSRSSRANKRFVTASSCSGTDGGGNTPRDCLAVNTNPHESNGVISLPHLGHSPSPRTGGSGGRGGGASRAAAAAAGTSTSNRLRHPPPRVIRPTRTELNGASDLVPFEQYLTRPLATKLASLEFKVEQLSQTCQLLVTENARLNSAMCVLLANQRLPPNATTPTADWSTHPHNGDVFATPPMLSVPTAGLFASPTPHFRPPALAPESISGVSSVRSLAPAPPTPTLQQHNSPSVENAWDQVQMLRAQVTEQNSRLNQLQSELHLALQKQQQQQRYSGSGEAVIGTNHHLASSSGIPDYQPPAVLGPTSALASLLALQQAVADVATNLQSRQPATAARNPTKTAWPPVPPKP